MHPISCEEEWRVFAEYLRILKMGFAGEQWRTLSWILLEWHFGRLRERGFELCVGSPEKCLGVTRYVLTPTSGAVAGTVSWSSVASSRGLSTAPAVSCTLDCC